MERTGELEHLEGLLARHRAVGLLGARQVGKTTLARAVADRRRGEVTTFDLENPDHLAQLEEPMLALEPLRGLVVIDEIQRRPDLFPILRVLIDRPQAPRFLLLGSASPDLLRQSSESLAGRIVYHLLSGFNLAEVGMGRLGRLWLRGGFPRSYLARSDLASWEWRRGFVQTFLERDLPHLGLRLAAATLQRFWSMLAHVHGQIWNAAEFARSFGVSDTTARGYLDLLDGLYLVRLLTPWFENIGKRQIRSPKVYFADTGLLHAILGLRTREAVGRHPKLGASWEGFMLSSVISRLGAESGECFFWATHGGAELDLLVIRGAERRGFEFKRTTTPKTTPAMRSALADLRLASLDVVHAGKATFALAPKIRAVGAHRLLEDIKPLR
ncbi:MAG: ATP-binding protein [Acidobacteria bacterium]|nr:ATP-binding protein [Acidobacteriota bacterium]